MSNNMLMQAARLTLQAGSTTLLSGLDWQVQAGEFWCVLGKNGIGKTTLLQTIAGLSTPAGGAVSAPAGEVGQLSPQALALWRGLLAQQQFDAFSCSVLDSVMSGLYPHHRGWAWPDAAEQNAARAALDALGMAAYADADIMRLSGGERQRVALATLLVQAPQLYLLDEPASHQDVAAQQMLMRVLRELAVVPSADQPGRAVIASMHDINLAARFATHILLIGAQRYWSGPVGSVLQPAVLQAAFDCDFEMLTTERGNWFMPLT